MDVEPSNERFEAEKKTPGDPLAVPGADSA